MRRLAYVALAVALIVLVSGGTLIGYSQWQRHAALSAQPAVCVPAGE